MLTSRDRLLVRPGTTPAHGRPHTRSRSDHSRGVPPRGGVPVCAAILRAVATLSRTDVEHVAHLARLRLDDDEIARLESQLNHIMEQYAVLAQLDTEHIPPTAQTIELENILREDEARDSLPAEQALSIAPARSGDYIVVPPILGSEED
jgi:aspartyl-tRNA(Asn)/glutamyl-tRNA(Gln) amidotransferase subunit C